MIKVRRFRAKDVIKLQNLVIKVQRTTLSKCYSKRIVEAFTKKHTRKRILERSRTRRIYVAEQNKKILGTINIKNNEIKGFFVHPDQMRMGIGKKLFLKVKTEIKKQRYRKIYVGSSLYAIGVYKKLGFKRIKNNYREIDGIKFYDIWMEKKI